MTSIILSQAAILPFTTGPDKRNGTAQADKLDGLAGNDTIFGFYRSHAPAWERILYRSGGARRRASLAAFPRRAWER